MSRAASFVCEEFSERLDATIIAHVIQECDHGCYLRIDLRTPDLIHLLGSFHISYTFTGDSTEITKEDVVTYVEQLYVEEHMARKRMGDKYND